MTQQVWKEKTSSIIHAIILYCLLLVVEAGLDLYQYVQIFNDLSSARGLSDLVSTIFGFVGPEDIIVQVLLFVSYIWLISSIKSFGREQKDLQSQLSLEKVGSALWLNFAATVVGMIPIPIICPLVSLIMEICSYAMMVSAFRYLMSSPVFNPVARSGAGSLRSYAVWSIWGIIPLIGGLFRFIAWIQFIRGWSKIRNGSPMQTIPSQTTISVNMMYEEPQSPPDKYINKVQVKTDEELKTILKNRDDYNPQLVKAAERVLLDRITGVDSPKFSDIEKKEITVEEPVISKPKFNDDKYKSYQPKPSSSLPEEKQEYSPVKTKDDSFEVVKSNWKTGSIESSQSKDASSPEVVEKEEDTIPASTSQKTNNAALLSILAGIALAVGGALGYYLWYVPYAKDRDATRMYVVADSVWFHSSGMADKEPNAIKTVPYGSQALTYDVVGDWALVKIAGHEGTVAADDLLSTEDFDLLNGAWGNSNVKDCIESTKCRLAILAFYKMNCMESGTNGWQIYTKAKDMKPNSVYYPRLYDKNSKFTDFMFLVQNNQNEARMLACYSFEDETENPIFRFNLDAPREGDIEKLIPYHGGVRVVFDNYQQLNITL